MRAIIILAGGNSERLKTSELLAEMGLLQNLQNKVEIPVSGVPIIERTVSLCSDYPLLVIREDVAKISKGLSIAYAMSRFSTQFDEFVVVLGDVVWQRSELQKLLRLSAGEALYHKENVLTEKFYEEFLGAVVSRSQIEAVSLCDHLRELPMKAGFARVLSDGWSDDIDTEEDYLERLPRLEKLVSLDEARRSCVPREGAAESDTAG